MPIIIELDVMLARRKMRSKELADAIGISETNLSLLKQGHVKGVRFGTLEAICRVLECQPGALRRALNNLLENAIKYGQAAHVRIVASPAAISIIIEDAGPGIPEADLRRVFEPFYRLEESRSRDTGGTGLGLSIALSVAQAHGGQIVLANRQEGGLRATLTLPR